MATGREFRIGPIFSRATTIYLQHFLLFTVVALVISIPSLFGGDSESILGGIRSFVVAIVGMILNFVGQAVILYGAFQAMRGRAVYVGDAIRRGLSRFWSILGLSILVGLGIAIGLILLIIPGIMLAVRWSVALPACVVENKGPFESMRRSADLTRGHRWKIFGIFVLLLIGVIVAGIIVAAIVGVIVAVGGIVGIVLAAVIGFVAMAIYTAYLNTVLVMIYHDLRAVKEGVDTEQIAAVFD
jgi:hypothetical protein